MGGGASRDIIQSPDKFHFHGEITANFTQLWVDKSFARYLGLQWKLEQDGRLPPAYFAPSQFGQVASWKMRTFFLEKTLFLHQIFFKFFQRSKIWFLAKKASWLGQKKHFSIEPLDTHSKATLLPLTILRRFKTFFLEKPIYFFSKKNQNFEHFNKIY